MPNHIMNRLRLSGEQSRIDELLESIRGADSVIDFCTILPIPDDLCLESGDRVENGLKAYADFISAYTLDGTVEKDLRNIPEKSEAVFLEMRTDIDPDEWRIGKAAFRGLQKYGVPTRYEWCEENWGTSWNAYLTKYLQDNTIEFNTYLRNARPLITALSRKYPEVEIEYLWASGNLGMDSGKTILRDGEIVKEILYAEKSKKSFELAAELWRLDLEKVGYIFNEEKQTYEYHDEQSESPQMS